MTHKQQIDFFLPLHKKLLFAYMHANCDIMNYFVGSGLEYSGQCLQSKIKHFQCTKQ